MSHWVLVQNQCNARVCSTKGARSPSCPCRPRRLYSPLPYHIAKSLVMLPFAIINVMVFCGTVYGMAGLRRDLDGLPVVQHMVIALMAYLLAQQVSS